MSSASLSSDSAPEVRSEGRRRSRLNQLTVWALIVVLVLAPLPLGGSRPLFWPAFAGALGLVLAFYGWQLSRQRLSLALPIASLWPEAVCWLLLCLYLVVQVLPIGTLFQWSFAAPDGTPITLPQLSLTPGTTLLLLTQMLGYGTMYLLAAQVSVRGSRARWLQIGIVGLVTASAVYGLLALTQFGDTLLGLTKWAYRGSATGTFVNRNTYATFLALGLVSATALSLGEIARARRSSPGVLRVGLAAAPAVAAVLLIAGALLATTSRMGAFAGVCGIISVALLGLVKSGRGWASALLIVILLFGAGAAVTTLYGQGLLDRLGSAEREFDGRATLYVQAWQLIQTRPFLGYGGGSFAYAFPLIHHEPVSLDLVWDRAHSTYLSLWAELGLIAGSLPVLAIVAILARLVGRWMRAGSFPAVGLAGIGAVVVVAIHSLVDFSLEIQAVAYLFAAILGAAVGNAAGPPEAGRHR